MFSACRFTSTNCSPRAKILFGLNDAHVTNKTNSTNKSLHNWLFVLNQLKSRKHLNASSAHRLQSSYFDMQTSPLFLTIKSNKCSSCSIQSVAFNIKRTEQCASKRAPWVLVPPPQRKHTHGQVIFTEFYYVANNDIQIYWYTTFTVRVCAFVSVCVCVCV